MAFLFAVPTDSEFEELQKALKKRDQFEVNRWLAEKTSGRVDSLNDELYEAWIFLAQMYSFPDLKAEVTAMMQSLK